MSNQAQEVKVQLVNGVLMPDIDTIRLMVASLKERVDQDETLREEYKNNPRLVLGSVGFSEDIQNEILLDDGRIDEIPEGCLGTCGGSGCACTGCCIC